MATFNYEVSFNGKVLAPNLLMEIKSAIDSSIKSGDLQLRDYRHPQFNFVYRKNCDSEFLAIGFNSYPGKVAGTEVVSVHFGGREKSILEAKSELLEKVKGLAFE